MVSSSEDIDYHSKEDDLGLRALHFFRDLRSEDVSRLRGSKKLSVSEEAEVIFVEIDHKAAAINFIPPRLSKEHPTHTAIHTFGTPTMNYEFFMHHQLNRKAKKLKSIAHETDEFKDGCGDFGFLAVLRSAGLFTLTANVGIYGLSAASKQLWQQRLVEWGRNEITCNGEKISLSAPDVALSRIMRHFVDSGEYLEWLYETENRCARLRVNTSDLNLAGERGVKEDIRPSYSEIATVLQYANEDLVIKMGEFRRKILLEENNLVLEPLLDNWYMNGIFAINMTLVFENQPGKAKDQVFPVFSSVFRSRADIMAISAENVNLDSSEKAIAELSKYFWLGDGNAYTDRLIESLLKNAEVASLIRDLLSKVLRNQEIVAQILSLLKKLSITAEELEEMWLRKVWRLYATLPASSDYKLVHQLEANTHFSANRTDSSPSLTNMICTDGALDVSWEALGRQSEEVDGKHIIPFIVNLIALVRQQQSGKIPKMLDEAGLINDDRLIQLLKIESKTTIAQKKR